MKKILAYISIVLLFAGCSSTKSTSKTTQQQVKEVVETEEGCCGTVGEIDEESVKDTDNNNEKAGVIVKLIEKEETIDQVRNENLEETKGEVQIIKEEIIDGGDEITGMLDRSVPPPPGPAPVINIGEYQSFQLENGLNVYVVENNKLPRVAFSLNIDRDPIFEGNKAGYIGMVGDLLKRGTATKTKAEIDEAIDFIGASLSTGSSSMYGSSLTRHTESLMNIMQDILMNPSFPADELEKLKKLQISNLASAKDDPGTIVTNIRNLIFYGKDHPYGEMMSEKSIEQISIEDCKSYFKKYWSPKQAHLAIIGDISVSDAKEMATKYFGNWKGEDIPQHEFSHPAKLEKTKVILVDRDQSVQSEIRIGYPVELNIGDKDFFSTKLLNQILGGGFSSRLMQNLREDKAYTYGAGSGFATDDLIGRFSAGASVRNEVTDSAVYEFLYELDNIAAKGITESELKAAKAYLTGSFARSLEQPRTIAGFAINTAVNELPKDYYQNYLKQLNAVTVEEVNAAAKNYIHADKAYVVVVGKASEIASKLKKFGSVEYYDVEGNPYDPAAMNSALTGVNPNTILNRYIDAIGGKEKLMAIKSQRRNYLIEIQGMKLSIVETKTKDGKFITSVSQNGQSVQSVVCDGGTVRTMAMGREIPMEKADIEAEMMNNRLFPELYYEQNGVKAQVKGIEKVNDEETYKLAIVYPSGKESYANFSMKTGLKVKETTMMEGPTGTTAQSATFKDFKEVDGIKYAHTSSTNMGPQQFDVTLDKIENNIPIALDMFRIVR